MQNPVKHLRWNFFPKAAKADDQFCKKSSILHVWQSSEYAIETNRWLTNNSWIVTNNLQIWSRNLHHQIHGWRFHWKKTFSEKINYLFMCYSSLSCSCYLEFFTCIGSLHGLETKKFISKFPKNFVLENNFECLDNFRLNFHTVSFTCLFQHLFSLSCFKKLLWSFKVKKLLHLFLVFV